MKFIKVIWLKTTAASLVLFVAGIGALYLISDETVQIEALRQQAGISNVADLSSGKIRYQFEGPKSGDLVFLIHGGREPAWTWDEVVPYLHGAGYRTLRYDMFGRATQIGRRAVRMIKHFSNAKRWSFSKN